MKKQSNVVERTKGRVGMVILPLLVIGWMCSIYSLLIDRELRAQTVLVQSAEIFLEDKLYIRAAGKYEEALDHYQTVYNEEIEKKLLRTYQAGEMWEEYYAKLRDRISEGKADAEEYLTLARFYLDSGNLNSAVQYLELGRTAFPENEELTAMDESVRYEVSVTATEYQEMGVPSTDSYIPVFNGEKWGYILGNGRNAISFQYEEATAFSGNYAVVRLDGVYTLIDKNGYWNAVDKNGLEKVTALCGTYLSAIKDGKYSIYTNTFNKISDEDYEDVCLNENGRYFVKKDGRWALLDDKLTPITDYIFSDVVKNSRGEAFYNNYAVVADEGGYYLINPDGEAWFTARFADAKGMESGLAAVADSTGKWGFCNENGELEVDYQYEDAASFSGKLGAVKYAGKWGYINRYNTMVIPNEYESAEPFAGEYGVVTDTQGYCRILKLKFYDVYMGQ